MPADVRWHRTASWVLSAVALTCCSSQDATPESETRAANAVNARAAAPAPPVVSRVIGKHDRMVSGGRTVCAVDFVYAGRAPEDVFWEEPCSDVTAIMVDRPELQRLDRWTRLSAFHQKFVEQMPGGRVLYVGGAFSASIYPVDETGSSIEVEVAD